MLTGDVNGDGISDWIISSSEEKSGNEQGVLYIVTPIYNGTALQIKYWRLSSNSGNFLSKIRNPEALGVSLSPLCPLPINTSVLGHNACLLASIRTDLCKPVYTFLVASDTNLWMVELNFIPEVTTTAPEFQPGPEPEPEPQKNTTIPPPDEPGTKIFHDLLTYSQTSVCFRVFRCSKT